MNLLSNLIASATKPSPQTRDGNSPHRKKNRGIELKTPQEIAIMRQSIQEAELEGGYNLVYYDAFGPTAQPELWGIPVLKKIRNAMARNGVLVTYCAQGQFKRNLRALGFQVESLPGPPGKREMVRASLMSPSIGP